MRQGGGDVCIAEIFTPPPHLLARATADVDAFRIQTMAALRDVHCHGAAMALKSGRWPAGMWKTLCAHATPSDDDNDCARRAVPGWAVARDYLGTLAAAHGLRFMRSERDEGTIVVDANGVEIDHQLVAGS